MLARCACTKPNHVIVHACSGRPFFFLLFRICFVVYFPLYLYLSLSLFSSSSSPSLFPRLLFCFSFLLSSLCKFRRRKEKSFTGFLLDRLFPLSLRSSSSSSLSLSSTLFALFFVCLKRRCLHLDFRIFLQQSLLLIKKCQRERKRSV
ncbi:hypothetical protein CSUI_002484 [Cystoisospora suis]|uniref:Transmembrane protein n=1 Tax=Cystoisospora suis TaxID=483139 RepID=A0A2C6L4H7_9APIC|nr:hypothetical protein CSUI_002484 [Cystoisospora suis]